MSTVETDIYWEYQHQILDNFEEMVEACLSDTVDVNDVIEELNKMRESDAVHIKTFDKALEYWETRKREVNDYAQQVERDSQGRY